MATAFAGWRWLRQCGWRCPDCIVPQGVFSCLCSGIDASLPTRFELWIPFSIIWRMWRLRGERRERRQSVRRFWMEFDLKSEPTLSAQRRSRPWDARCTLDSTLRRVLYSKRKSKDISLSPQSTHQCVITNRRKRRSTLGHWASGVWLHFTTFGGAMWEVKKTFSQSPWHFAGREWSWKVELSLCLDCNFTPSVRNAARKCEICQTKAWNISPGPCRAFYAIFIQLGRLLANHHHKPSSMQISFSL